MVYTEIEKYYGKCIETYHRKIVTELTCKYAY